MVSAAESSQLLLPVRRMRQIDTVLCRQVFELFEAGLCESEPPQRPIVVARAQGYRGFERTAKARRVFARDVTTRESGPRRDHAAADVDAYRRWNDRSERRDHRARRPRPCRHARRHQRDVGIDKGKRRRLVGLLHRARIDVAGEIDDLSALELSRHRGFALPCRTQTMRRLRGRAQAVLADSCHKLDRRIGSRPGGCDGGGNSGLRRRTATVVGESVCRSSLSPAWRMVSSLPGPSRSA